jgi:hypothetical protein
MAAWFCLVPVLSMGLAMHLESIILRQPSQPAREYSVAMEIKGVTRYVTPSQKMYHTLGLVGFFGGMVLAAGAVYLSRRNSN